MLGGSDQERAVVTARRAAVAKSRTPRRLFVMSGNAFRGLRGQKPARQGGRSEEQVAREAWSSSAAVMRATSGGT